nr:hypothetical protein [uncultured Halomonas sp.]
MKMIPIPAPPAGFPALRVLILVTGLALAACAWYAFAHWLHRDSDVTWFPPAASCNLHAAPCSATLGDKGRITLSVQASGKIDALEILPLEVDVDGVTATQVDVDFVGRDMDLGLHRFALSASTPGQFKGQGQVGICTQTVMPWRARVILETAEGKVGSWFDFDVIRS